MSEIHPEVQPMQELTLPDILALGTRYARQYCACLLLNLVQQVDPTTTKIGVETSSEYDDESGNYQSICSVTFFRPDGPLVFGYDGVADANGNGIDDLSDRYPEGHTHLDWPGLEELEDFRDLTDKDAEIVIQVAQLQVFATEKLPRLYTAVEA